MPEDVTAPVRRTSPLGRSSSSSGPTILTTAIRRCSRTAVIEETEVVPDFEQVVRHGVLAALGASEIAVMLEEEARFGGQGANIRAVLSNLETVTEGFAGQTDDITTLIQAIDELSAATGPSAQAHAGTLNPATTTQILDESRTTCSTWSSHCPALSREGRASSPSTGRVDRQLQALRTVTSAIVQERGALASLLSSRLVTARP